MGRINPDSPPSEEFHLSIDNPSQCACVAINPLQPADVAFYCDRENVTKHTMFRVEKLGPVSVLFESPIWFNSHSSATFDHSNNIYYTGRAKSDNDGIVFRKEGTKSGKTLYRGDPTADLSGLDLLDETALVGKTVFVVAERGHDRVLLDDTDHTTSPDIRIISEDPDTPTGVAFAHDSLSGDFIYIAEGVAAGRIFKFPNPESTPVSTVASIAPGNDIIPNDCPEDPLNPETAAARVLFYRYDEVPLGDPDPFQFMDPTVQTESGIVTLAATLVDVVNGAYVYFEAKDPDDLAEYDDPLDAPDDNETPAGFSAGEYRILPAPGFSAVVSDPWDTPDDPKKVVVLSVAGIAKASLEFTQSDSGDDYLVRVRADALPPSWTPAPIPPGEFEYPRFVAWSRYYLEVDQMYDVSFNLVDPPTPPALPVTVEVGTCRLELFPSEGSLVVPLPEEGETLTVFDAKLDAPAPPPQPPASDCPLVPPGTCSPCPADCPVDGEERKIFSRDVSMMPFSFSVILECPLCCEYKTGYNKFLGGKGAAVIVAPVFGGGPVSHIAQPLTLDVAALSDAYDDVRIELKEFVNTGVSSGHTPNKNLCKTAGCLSFMDYSAVWFGSAATVPIIHPISHKDKYFHLVGADKNTGWGRTCSGSCAPCDTTQLEGRSDNDENWIYVWNSNIDSEQEPPVCGPPLPPCEETNKELLAHEMGHQFFLEEESAAVIPSHISVEPCLKNPAPTPPQCLMWECMNPADGTVELHPDHNTDFLRAVDPNP